MNFCSFEMLDERDVAIGATRETGTILSFAVRTEHRGLARNASLRGHTRFELDSNGSCGQAARQTVAGSQKQFESVLRSLNGKTKNYVLVTESRELEVTDVVQKKRDDDMVSENIVTLGIDLTRQVPGVQTDARSACSIERKAKDFSVVKTRPPSKPLNQRLGPGEVVDCITLIFRQDESPFDGDGYSVAAAQTESGYAAF